MHPLIQMGAAKTGAAKMGAAKVIRLAPVGFSSDPVQYPP